MEVELSEATVARLQRLVDEGGYNGIEDALEAILDWGAAPEYSDAELDALLAPAEESLREGRTRPAADVLASLRARVADRASRVTAKHASG